MVNDFSKNFADAINKTLKAQLKKIAANPSTVNDHPLAVQEFYYKNLENIDEAI